LISNKGRDLDNSQQFSNDLIDLACSDKNKIELSKLSEEANFALKNTFKHQKDTMNWAKKDKMPIEKRKVKDILRNQHIVRSKIEKDIETYTKYQDNTQLENGILTYVNEMAWGDLKDLLRDVGINRETIQFTNMQDLVKMKDAKIHDSDHQLANMANARFT
jgi:hypothetical protein